MSNEVEKCAHKICQCQARKGDKYCSQFCADSKGVTTLQCDCGHPSCTAAKI